mgnify:CR=1 FL=1
MEISKLRCNNMASERFFRVNGDGGTGRKVFSWKPGDRVVAAAYLFCLEIKSLAYEGGAGNRAYRLSRISMRDYCPRGWQRPAVPGGGGRGTPQILVVVVVYSKGGPLGFPTHS